ncbi:hypothetical protein SG34_032105 [Thalassomonas viridans]|uniref:Uncharacterized protein n=1 Tax=Thalassomonas viridans TaxID=137584 RepID=A0AAE9Z8P4_9GAMM|nr:hypothetical protein [Thalassomonas viridans]WDE08568.1 hypothetical protein SG34_032105 [Thalassomonas viridans]
MKHWKKCLFVLAIGGVAIRYWLLYSQHLDTARLVSLQMCVVEGESLDPVNDELITIISNQLINRKLAGDSFIERAALSSAIADGLTCEPFDLL